MKKNYYWPGVKALILGTLCCGTLNLLACACSDKGPGGDGGKDTTPKGNVEIKISPDRKTVLRNPLNGWVAYMSRDADENYWNALDNIYVTDIGETVRMTDYANTAYIRTSWASLNPSDGVYTWKDPNARLTKAINAAYARDMKIAFRIVVDGRDQGMNTPKWVFDAGAKSYTENSNYPQRVTPFPQDPVFQQYYEKFIKALAEEFNDPDKCAFIDAYGLGKWGEAHNTVYFDPATNPSRENNERVREEVIDWIVDLYTTTFTEIPLVINYHRLVGYPQSEGTPNANSERLLDKMVNAGYSLRHDAFGMTSSQWGYSTWEKNYAAKWRYKRPIIMEGGWITGGTHSYWTDGSGKYVRDQPGTVRQGEFDEAMGANVNMMDMRAGLDGTSWFTETFGLVQRFVSEGGYRLYPDQISLPESISTGGGDVTITHRWRNLGWGYCPNNIPQWNYKYKVAFALLDANDNVKKIFVDSQGEPSEWLEQPVLYEFKTEIKGVSVGYYTWAVAIVDTTKDNTPGIQLAVDQSKLTADGWFKLNAGLSSIAN